MRAKSLFRVLVGRASPRLASNGGTRTWGTRLDNAFDLLDAPPGDHTPLSNLAEMVAHLRIAVV